jgi:hypothetical protein
MIFEKYIASVYGFFFVEYKTALLLPCDLVLASRLTAITNEAIAADTKLHASRLRKDFTALIARL